MAYHETRNFPDTEKDGLAKELRATSMLLLRTITRESVKSQKDFLNALDKTIEIQLDILLLLKLAFRMGFIDQGVYQTMEEDLKGLESITNEMKGMHGIPVSTDSIFTQLKPDKQQSAPSDTSRQKEKPKKAKPARQSSNRSRHSRSPKAKSEKIPPGKQKKQKLEEVIKPRNSEPATSIDLDNFTGTPLYEDDANVVPSTVSETRDLNESKSADIKESKETDIADEKETPKKKTRKKPSRSRWSLKRSTSKKPAGKPKLDK